ncbi:MAG: hypothetical protein H6722_29580 [Sandaracinus sp.]|nr:hypothetical protein [Sandaracinus sp.]MCB9624342.1 hypothetical protein [Sandaracinus sp.]
MKRLSVLAFGVMFGVACNDDPACVIDTDCDIGEYCSTEQRCEIVGGMVDAGERDAETPMDAGTPDAGADGGVDSGPEQIGTGSVVATSTPSSYSVFASFALRGAASSCTVTEPSAECVLTVCPPPMMVEDAGMPDAGMVDAGMPVAPHAGVITIGGGATETVTLTPGADGLYPAATSAAMALWPNSDAILTVMGAGDEVPMFGVTLAGPDAVVLMAPMPGSVPVASDLAVTWTGSSPGDVVVSMSAIREGTVTVECRFEPSAGMGSVPTAALSAMGAGAAFVAVRSEQTRNISRAGWDIGVSLQAPSGVAALTLE